MKETPENQNTVPPQAFPVSHAQQRLWFLEQLQQGNSAYYIPSVCRLQGLLNVAALEKAVSEIVHRHEILRTNFRMLDGRLAQVVAPSMSIEIPVIEITGANETSRELQARALVMAESRKRFNLENGPLLRVSLLCLGPQSHILLVIMHHIVSDGWSMGIFYRELGILYEAFSAGKPSPLPDLSIQYVDFAIWQQEHLQGKVLESHLASWKKQLQGAPEFLEISTDYARPATQTYRGTTCSLDLEEGLYRQIKELCRREGVTLFMALLAVYQLLLHRYSGQDDIVVGTPTAGRNQLQLQDLIGFFINTVAIRVSHAGEPSFRQLLERVKQASLEALAHEELPFEKLVEALHVRRDLSYPPIFQVFFNLVNFDDNIHLAGLEVSDYPVDELDSKFDFTLYIVEQKSKSRLDLVYNRDLFSPQRMEEMLHQFRSLLQQVVQNPDELVSGFSLWDGASALPHPEVSLKSDVEELLPSRFSVQAAANERIALVDAQSSWTYGALEACSNQLAHRLRAGGIQSQDVVVIFGEKCASLVWAMLGVLKAGAAFAILDPQYPDSRLADYVRAARPAGWITLESSLANGHRSTALLEDSGFKLVLSVAGNEQAAALRFCEQYPQDPPSISIQAEDPAYVVFTSGTTGKPNAVVTPHAALAHFLNWHTSTFKFSGDDKFSMLSGLSHDPVLRDVFSPLWIGATLCIPTRETVAVPRALRSWIREQQISVAHVTPGLVTLLSEGWQTETELPLQSLRYVFFGGEVLTHGLVGQFYELAPAANCVNFYGASETPQAIAYYTIPPPKEKKGQALLKQTVPIGRGIADVQLLVVNSAGQMAGVGELGEIFVRTPFLSHGYLHNEPLTRQKFVANPFTGTQGDKVYMTGDLGRYLADGNVEFHGRLDGQLKVRGFRIEAAEIENVLRGHASVGNAVVCARQDGKGRDLLAAYVVCAGEVEQKKLFAELKTLVRVQLPEYMVPAVFVVLKSLPLTPNNKVNYRALPNPVETAPHVSRHPVGDVAIQLEQKITAIWRDVLPVNTFGRDENFFDLGGNSLLLASVHNRLEKLVGRELSLIELFRYSSVALQAEYLAGTDNSQIAKPVSKTVAASPKSYSVGAIAVVGMAGRFPGAGNVDEYWHNLCAGKESVEFYTEDELTARGVDPELLRDPNYVRAGAGLKGIREFDAAFFGMNPREAELTDPQHRLALECAYEALESAGYDPESYTRPVGVFAGASASTYLIGNILANPELLASLGGFSVSVLHGNEKDYLPTRISYKLGLKGPSMAVQTACSSSLVAISRACQSLISGECDLALAGGASANVWQDQGYVYQPDSILSPDGHCRAFDAGAQGTIFGSGVGFVALRRLEDALADRDQIISVIRGFATNNDGARRMGYTAPSPDGQADVITAAMANAGVAPDAIQYVETHGTGTALGDPVEVTALSRAFQTGRQQKQFCAIGSVKTNIGHLNAAAGVAGFIKAALAVKHGIIPPSLHYKEPNPQIDFPASPFYVNTETRVWSSAAPRLGGVSSFGIGGTNAHVILEQPPVIQSSPSARPFQLLVLSAQTDKALRQAGSNLAHWLSLNTKSELADSAYTLAVGRKKFAKRLAVICESGQEAIGRLTESVSGANVMLGEYRDGRRRVAMLFSGQGSQYLGMGAQLYKNEPVFRAHFDRSSDFLKTRIGLDLREILFGQEETQSRAELIKQTWVTQPALYALELALVKLWQSWGIQPDIMIGHSLGELVAATVAGVMTEEEGLALVAERGRLMAETEPGSMLGAMLSDEVAQAYLRPGISLAAINASEQVVFSGDHAQIAELERELVQAEITVRKLEVTRAFHSAKMETVRSEFLKFVEPLDLKTPQRPYISNVSGEFAGEEVTDPEYWWLQIRQPVQFLKGIRAIANSEGACAWLEVGPGEALANLVRAELLASGHGSVVVSTTGKEKDREREQETITRALGQLWTNGVTVDWKGYYQNEERQRVALPTYPFQRKEYWIEPGKAIAAKNTVPTKQPRIEDWFYVPSWKRTGPLSLMQEAGAQAQGGSSLVFAMEGELSESLLVELHREGKRAIVVRQGPQFQCISQDEYELNPRNASDYLLLWKSLAQKNATPRAVYQLWSLTADTTTNIDPWQIEEVQYAGFYSLLYIAQAQAELYPDGKLDIIAVTSGLQDVHGEAIQKPERATILGPCRVIPQEHANIGLTCVDLHSDDITSRNGLAANLLSELSSEMREPVVAYRNGYRWIQTFETVRLKQKQLPNSRIKDGGVYLITGGMGGIALTLAEHFTQGARVKLALLGRSAFPEKSEWAGWLETHDVSDPLSQKITRLLALEATGAELLISSADITDAKQLESTIATIEKRFGKINGVVHAAGIAGGGLIALKTESVANAVIAPKLQGTLNLAHALQGSKLDFLVLCSSRASVLGGAGQVDYCAANNFLDVFAPYYTLKTGTPTVAINWGAWQEVGMAVATAVPAGLASARRASLLSAMTPKEGIVAFDKILASSLTQVVVSPQELTALIHEQSQSKPDEHAAEIGAKPDEENRASQSHARPDLAVAFRSPGSEIERAIASIWEHFLGIAPVGIDDDFLELGGHSLLATQVISKLRSKLGVEVSVRMLFQNPTVAALAGVIDASHTESQVVKEMIPLAPRNGDLLLSFAQQRLWLLEQIQHGSSAYNIFSAIRLTGALDVDALQYAQGEVVRRHESLRTTFPEVDGQAVQRISAYDGQQVLQVLDLHMGPEVEQADRIVEILNTEAQQQFDLAQGPLFRAKLTRVAAQEHILQITMHHIISDGWSTGILVREIAALYNARVTGAEAKVDALPVQYSDYALWQRQWLTGDVKQSQLDYWKKQLTGAPTVLQLPTDNPRPRVRTMRGATEYVLLKPELLKRLHEISREQGATLYMVLLAAFNVLLSRYSGQKDIVIGSPIAGRNRAELESLVGFFVNALVLRCDLQDDPDFTELLARVKEVCLSAYAHQDLPFEMLVDELQVERNLSHSPLFQTVFVLQNAPRKSLELAKLGVEYLPIQSTTAKFDLTLIMQESQDGLETWLEYDTDLFESSTIRRMLGHLTSLVEGIAATPELKISKLPMLSREERREWLAEREVAVERYATSGSLSSWFELQAQATPDAVAVTLDHTQVSYRELNGRANQLAHHLRSVGVNPGDSVGICVDRSIEMIVSVLGTSKAGAAYVPMDPAYPAERVSFILADSAVTALITKSDLSETAPEYCGRIVNWQSDGESIARESEDNLDSGSGPEDVAYVIYTSGSTGKPKGVAVTHHNVMRLLHATQQWFGFNKEDVWTLFHSYAFDFSVWEIWGALLYGGRLVIVPYWVSRTPEAFRTLLVEESVTVLNQTPSAFRQLIAVDQESLDQESGPNQTPFHLRYVIFGGEALDPKILQPWIARYGDCKPKLVNMYGITETTVHVTYAGITEADLQGAARSIIGLPIPDLRMDLLDEHMEPVPAGVAGEIFVGGDGVALGYLNRPELTAERFLPDPFSQVPGARLYRSGDLARQLSGGDIEYLGRADHQVKIRGFRIELGEIEAVLAEYDTVREAVVVARPDENGGKRLIAYLIPTADETVDIQALRTYLSGKLPDHMVPAAYVLIDHIPLTPHGKLDHRELPDPSVAALSEQNTYRAPQNNTERLLAEAWAKVLEVDRAGIDDNFFAMGGDSIRSIQLRAAARTLGLDFSLQQLFQCQTIRRLASEIVSSGTLPALRSGKTISLLSDSDKNKLPREVEDAYPLTMLQTGMVFHSEMDPASAVYHDIFSYLVRVRFDLEKFREAVVMLASRHAVLRTSFDLKTFSTPLQLVHKAIVAPVESEDLRNLLHAEQDRVIASWIESEKTHSFYWADAPLFRFRLHRRTDDTVQINFSFHHAILDGWSVASLLTELFQIYMGRLVGESAISQPLAAAFKDYVANEQALLAAEDARQFWTGYLEGAEPLHLPSSKLFEKKPHSRTVDAYRVAIPLELSNGLKKVAAENSVPIKTVLLAAHLRVLRQLQRESDVMTGVVTNGRPEEKDGERVLGLFLNTLPFRLNLRGGSWSDLIRETFAVENRLLPFRSFPLAQLQKLHGGEPLFDVVFNFIHFHVYDALEKLSGFEILGGKAYEETNFSLVANFSQTVERAEVGLNLLYDNAVLRAQQIQEIAGYYLRALTAIAQSSKQSYETTELMAEQEHRQLLSLGDPSLTFVPGDVCVHQLFHTQARGNPERLALVAPHLQMTYGELDKATNRLANYLRTLGVTREVRVGVCVESGAEMVISALAILKSGGAYLPMDPAYPAERCSYMIQNSGARVVITERKFAETFSQTGAHLVILDSDDAVFFGLADTPPALTVSPTDLAYTIYTSGSSGKPKGVDVSHSALLNLVAWHQKQYAVTAQDRATQIASMGFDAAVWEIWPYLATGAQIHVPDNETRRSTRKLVRWLIQQGTTISFLPTPLAEALLDEPEISRAVHLRALLTGGDQLRRGPQSGLPFRLINHYGPTENAVVATWTEVEENQSNPPIGNSIANVQVFVLNSNMSLVPMGVPGELYIAGESLARGYVENPEETALKFVPNPFSQKAGTRLYATGDLVRWLPNQQLEFLGRIDQQVKVRGHRIELGEIEAVLKSCDQVGEVVVEAREDASSARHLVAYVVAQGGAQEETEPKLRAMAAGSLPEYMHPQMYVFLEHIPMTVNGKIDRKRLPAPDWQRYNSSPEYIAPKTAVEIEVARVWAEVLGSERIGLNDNFFHAGGDSLKAIRAISRMADVFEVEVPLSTLFDAPELGSFVAVMVQRTVDNLPAGELESLLEEIGAVSEEEARSLLAGQVGDTA